VRKNSQREGINVLEFKKEVAKEMSPKASDHLM
jgi:hypothetical protein